MPTVIKSKITVTNFKPKTIPFDKYATAPYPLGLIIGRVDGISERIDQRDGAVYRGLKGTFAQVIGDPKDGNIINSGICYLPEAMQNLVEAAYNEIKNDKGAVVDFVYEVCLGRRGEQDYEWIFRDLVPAKAANPIEGLIAAGVEKSALSAPVEEPAAIADGTKGKAKA